MQDPRPHISLLWCLGDKEMELGAIAAHLNSKQAAEVPLMVDKVVCKVGQKVYIVWEHALRTSK